MVEVFSEVRRTLRDDGTLWLNLGDCYAGSVGSGGSTKTGFNNRYFGRNGALGKQGSTEGLVSKRKLDHGLKTKDLIGIPWRVAFALQADGWWLRSDIIWHKPNPMPESVTDRPTKAHEYIFLLSKSSRYYYDADAIKMPARDSTLLVARRSVWSVASNRYPGSHFATFPPKLVEPCVLAGCPEGGIVLDPFFGSGTTGQVAEQCGRAWFGVELNPEYETLIRERTAQRGLFVGAL